MVIQNIDRVRDKSAILDRGAKKARTDWMHSLSKAFAVGGMQFMATCRKFGDFAFEPELIKAMTMAYEDGLKFLGNPDPASAMAEVLAENIIEFAKRGERDPIRLCQKALGTRID